MGTGWSKAGKDGGGKTRWQRAHSLRLVAGSGSSPGQGPRSCWQLPGGGRGHPLEGGGGVEEPGNV